MKKINKTFDKEILEILSNLKKHKLIKLKHDQFMVNNSVSKYIYINVDSYWLCLKNEFEVIDFWGDKEEVSFYDLSYVDENDIKPYYDNTALIYETVESIIKDIYIINEKQEAYINNELYETIDFVRALILKTETKTYVFEKDIWLSEEIYIYQGEEIINSLMNDYKKIDNEAFDDGFLKIDRTLIKL
ncbi:MAG: hypothetical protein MJ244_03580 [Clostridia bacterium]|nr:hypothetical protein [Clostridia bacterium]